MIAAAGAAVAAGAGSIYTDIRALTCACKKPRRFGGVSLDAESQKAQSL